MYLKGITCTLKASHAAINSYYFEKKDGCKDTLTVYM